MKGQLGGRFQAPKGGRGRMGGTALGPGGSCRCPSCGATITHNAGVPCYSINCPKCGTSMVR